MPASEPASPYTVQIADTISLTIFHSSLVCRTVGPFSRLIMPHFVYMLRCKGNRIYTGYAVDVDARYEEHCSGRGARFTKAFPPECILRTFELETREEENANPGGDADKSTEEAEGAGTPADVNYHYHNRLKMAGIRK